MAKLCFMASMVVVMCIYAENDAAYAVRVGVISSINRLTTTINRNASRLGTSALSNSSVQLVFKLINKNDDCVCVSSIALNLF